mgnify:CR=1 FL=1
MPGMDGFDFLKIFRESEFKNQSKVLVISGDTHEKLEKARKEGASEVLEKPFTNDELLKKINSLMEATASPDRKGAA